MERTSRPRHDLGDLSALSPSVSLDFGNRPPPSRLACNAQAVGMLIFTFNLKMKKKIIALTLKKRNFYTSPCKKEFLVNYQHQSIFDKSRGLTYIIKKDL